MRRSATHFVTASVLAALSPSGALADLRYANDSGGSVIFYGHFSPAYLSFDDGVKSYDDLVDNAHSNSRVGLNLDQALGNGQSLRFTFETSLGAPQSSKFSQLSQPEWIWEKTDIRKLELIWTGGFGKLYLGQGPMASDGVATRDLSGTTMASSVTTADTAGGYFWRLQNGDLSGITLGDTFDTFDGNRKGRIRYDTPSWNGLYLAIAYGTDVLQNYGDKWYADIGLHYDNTIGNVEYSAGLGYSQVYQDGVDTRDAWAGSISALHLASGINGTISAGGEKDGAQNAYGKIGWIGEIWSVGDTAISADYTRGRDFETNGSESTQWGIQAAQYFDDWNLEAYIGYAEYAFDETTGDSYRDASSVLAGLRWKF